MKKSEMWNTISRQGKGKILQRTKESFIPLKGKIQSIDIKEVKSKDESGTDNIKFLG